MLTHKTIYVVTDGTEERHGDVVTEGKPEFVLPAGFRMTWPAVDFRQAHEERKRK